MALKLALVACRVQWRITACQMITKQFHISAAVLPTDKCSTEYMTPWLGINYRKLYDHEFDLFNTIFRIVLCVVGQ